MIQDGPEVLTDRLDGRRARRGGLRGPDVIVRNLATTPPSSATLVRTTDRLPLAPFRTRKKISKHMIFHEWLHRITSASWATKEPKFPLVGICWTTSRAQSAYIALA